MASEAQVKLTDRLNAQVESWKSTVDTIKDIWDQSERLYNVDPAAVNKNVIEGLQPYTYSIWTAKADKLVGDMVSALTSPSPMVQIIANNVNDVSTPFVEQAVETIFNVSGFKRKLQQSLIKSANTNLGVIQLYPMGDDQGLVNGIDADWLMPQDFFLYPADTEYLEDAITVGHRFYETKSDILLKIKEGTYGNIGTDQIPTANKTEYEERPGDWDLLSSVVDYASPDDEPVECFDAVTREGRKLRHLIWIKDTNLVLVDEEYPYEMPWYSVLRFLRAEQRLICNGSLASKVADYCFQHSDLMNLMTGGVMMTAFPIIWTKGLSSTIQVRQIMPGQIIDLPVDTEIGVLPNGFQAQNVAASIQMLEGMIEQTLGISSIATGKMPGQETKATTINVLASNDQKRQASYLDAISEGIEDAALLIVSYLQNHYNVFSEEFKAMLPPELGEDMTWTTASYRAEVTGKSADSNPEVILARLQMLLQMAAAPGSPIDPGKTQIEMLSLLNLPIPANRLLSDQYTQIQRALADLEANGINPQSVIEAGIKSIMAVADEPNDGPPEIPGMGGGAESPIGEGALGATQAPVPI
jgi:hypothetical protein